MKRRKKKKSLNTGILSVFPGHHEVKCSSEPRPPHHDGLKPLKLSQNKVSLL
jgi:hypothetical protein